jgi:LysR family transcriptional regulator, low CO2-responsive transcriptional regulator
VRIDVVLEIGSREGIWKSVEQGLGIGFVADFEFIPHPNLRAIPIHDAVISTQYFLAYLKERQSSRLIRAFCEVSQT